MPDDQPNKPLNYRSPLNERQDRQRDSDYRGGSTFFNGFLGFIYGGACFVGIIYLMVNRVFPPDQLIVIGPLLGVLAIGGAACLNWGAKFRGFLPGMLLAVGLGFVCPITAVLVICGGVGRFN